MSVRRDSTQDRVEQGVELGHRFTRFNVCPIRSRSSRPKTRPGRAFDHTMSSELGVLAGLLLEWLRVLNRVRRDSRDCRQVWTYTGVRIIIHVIGQCSIAEGRENGMQAESGMHSTG